MVLGNKYWYEGVEVDSFDAHVLFNTIQEPSPLIFEIPIQSFTTKVIDTPPPRPEIEFISYQGVSDQIALYFNSSINSSIEFPIDILEKDKELIKKYRHSQKLKDNEPIKFGGDDRIEKYQIFRLEENKPRSYKDFKNGVIKEVKTDISSLTIQKANSASILDKIKPNTKYYYCFRSIDIHRSYFKSNSSLGNRNDK